ncbi:MAG: hypothetical protein HZA09_07515, partial [Nitrospirae bacterium]|nr:hypothetical protein [Nitrospirota bacterium]
MSFKKKTSFVFVVLIVLTLTIFTYQSIRGGEDTSVFDSFIYPLKILERGVSSLFKDVKGLINRYILITQKEGENKRLLSKLKELEQERNKFIEALSENKRLRDIL